jgi:hypothetical protein
LPARVKLFGPFVHDAKFPPTAQSSLIDVLDGHLVGWRIGLVESVRALDRATHFRRQGKAFGTTSDGFERPRRPALSASR